MNSNPICRKRPACGKLISWVIANHGDHKRNACGSGKSSSNVILHSVQDDKLCSAKRA